MDVISVVGGIALSLAVLGMVGAVLWSLYDVVVRADDVELIHTVLWVVLILALNTIGAILYVRFGPGRERWSPWTAWQGAKAR